ncbi:MAG: hypothetical protein NC038_00215 [Paludibacter sp.]|nr:hypothetical protein [Bacteroidales bacterium]MCM1068685.1 hypothetical protein [Prevotella sp.]MCM1353349.1 hypothetical protein [Bacteroides sp.]MCM1442243.1 hypothetical protein [Muribaculum sp.]MCM1481062.1 hypothetical protein [Paludibacter sp.]
MKKFIDIFPKVVLGILLIGCACFSAVVLLHLGGSEGTLEVAGDMLDIPNYTNPLIYFCYTLLGLAIVATLYAVIAGFVGTCQSDKKSALKSLGILVAFVAVLVVCWFLGSPEEVQILGYEGTENVGGWAQFTDAVMYATYILVAGTVLAIIWGAIYSRVKK